MPIRVSKTLQFEEAKRLLAENLAIQDSCALDLLVFLHRHPRTLLTSEHLAQLIGYESEDIACALQSFVGAGLLEEREPLSRQTARLLVLVLDGPQRETVRSLLTLASTRNGRVGILKALNEEGSCRKSTRGPSKDDR